MSTIARHKFGDCSRCSAESCAVVKRAKDLLCLSCAKSDSNKKYIDKAEQRNKIRSLYSVQSKVKKVLDTTRQDLIGELDTVVSLYVRIRDSDKNGIATCYTCGNKKHYSKHQCGHFVSRSHMGLRFDARNNLRTQCEWCNCNLNGNIKVYRATLEKEESGLPERLEEQGRQVEHISITELDFLLREYKQKLSIIKQKLLVK